MMNINVNRPMTMGQMAQLYSNPHLSPEAIDSDMRFKASRGHSFVQEQARNLGIGDPVKHFASERLAAAMQTQTAQLQESRMYEMAGVPHPNSEWARNKAMTDGASALRTAFDTRQAAEAKQVASLQTANRLKAYPLPIAGQAPKLSPVMQEDMRHQGITDPMKYLISQRLGGLARGMTIGNETTRPEVELPERIGNTGINADTLMRSPTFRNADSQNPERGARVFEAITGGDLGTYEKTRATARAARVKGGVNYFQKGLEDGLFRLGKNQMPEQRGRAVDPITGKLGLGAEYGPIDEYGRGLWAENEVQEGVVGPEMLRLAQLETQMNQPGSARVMPPRTPLAQRAGTPEVFQTEAFARLQRKNPALAASLWARMQGPKAPVYSQPMRTGY